MLQEESRQKSASTTANLPAWSKAGIIYNVLKDRNIRLNCLFVTSVLPLIDKSNVMLQKEEPFVHKLYSVLRGLMKDLLVRFIKPDAIVGKDILHVKYHDSSNYKQNSDIVIGEAAKSFIEEQGASKFNLSKFYKNVIKFYTTALDYYIEKLPIKNEILFHVQVADITQRSKLSFSSVRYLLKQFPCVVPKDVSEDEFIDKLEQEFLSYQVNDFTSTCIDVKERIDSIWYSISQLKDPANEEHLFANLAHFMLSVLCIFHSNAPCERIFSLVTYNKDSGRSSMSTRMLESLLIRKIALNARDSPCYKSVYSDDLLKAAKSATYNHLHK